MGILPKGNDENDRQKGDSYRCIVPETVGNGTMRVEHRTEIFRQKHKHKYCRKHHGNIQQGRKNNSFCQRVRPFFRKGKTVLKIIKHCMIYFY